MDPEQTTALIACAGGDAAFARLLGIANRAGFKQRVNNWKRRGMPASVVLEHHSTIMALQRRAECAAVDAA